MPYKPKVVDFNLEQVMVTGLSDDHGSVASPPMSGARVPTASLK
jgi:hypothetical protein